MGLYIRYRVGDRTSHRSFCYRSARGHWHINDERPDLEDDIEQGRQVMSVQANGDELVMIQKLFTNIPMVSGSHDVEWCGDLAAFIVYNLPSKYEK